MKTQTFNVLLLGYSALRPQQELAVKSFVQGNDVFISLPTGGGKSLCYSILPDVFDALRTEVEPSIVIIVSPLIALMKDQVRSMTERGMTAVFVGDCSKLYLLPSMTMMGQKMLKQVHPLAFMPQEYRCTHINHYRRACLHLPCNRALMFSSLYSSKCSVEALLYNSSHNLAHVKLCKSAGNSTYTY